MAPRTLPFFACCSMLSLACSPATGGENTEQGTTTEIGTDDSAVTGRDDAAETTGLSESGSSESDGGDEEGPGELECKALSACVTACVRPWTWVKDGFACECTTAPSPPDHAGCEVADLVGNVPDEYGAYLRLIQAMRYRVYGRHVWTSAYPSDGMAELVVAVHADGTGQVHWSAWSHGCCNGTEIEGSSWYSDVVSFAEADDERWQTCLAEAGTVLDGFGTPKCVGYPQVPIVCGTHQPYRCPDIPQPPAPDESCEVTCPMANDGVCDEPGGTNLCPEGCDPIDCTCEDDVPGQCDEVSRGGLCPLASDLDDCMVL